MALLNHRVSNHINSVVVVSELIIWLWILAIATMAITGGEPPPDPDNYSNIGGYIPTTEFTPNRTLNRCIDFATLVSLIIWNVAIRHSLFASSFIIARVVSLWMGFIAAGFYWILIHALWC